MEKTTLQAIKKIVILGAESSGKTDLCHQLATHYHTTWVPEYARVYFNTHDINRYTVDELDNIAIHQLQMETDFLTRANRFLFCDTALITIKIWSEHKFNKVSDFINSSIKARDYDLYLVCNNDVEWQADPQRLNPELREQVLQWNVHELIRLNVPYHIIE